MMIDREATEKAGHLVFKSSSKPVETKVETDIEEKAEKHEVEKLEKKSKKKDVMMSFRDEE